MADSIANGDARVGDALHAGVASTEAMAMDMVAASDGRGRRENGEGAKGRRVWRYLCVLATLVGIGGGLVLFAEREALHNVAVLDTVFSTPPPPPLPHRRVDHAFAIICQGRSGSTYLTHMLDQHPNLTVHGEMLHAPNYAIKSKSGSCHYEKFQLNKNHKAMVREYLDMFIDDRLCEYGFCEGHCDRQGTALVRPEETGGVSPCGPACVAKKPGEYKGMVGLKILFGSQFTMALPALQSYDGFRVLFLVRRDVLMRSLSALHRKQKQLDHAKKLIDNPLQASVEQVVRKVESCLRAEEAHYRKIERLNAKHIVVWYENLVTAQLENRWDDGPWHKITDFLGVQPHALASATIERHPKTTLEAVHELYPQIAEYRRAARTAFPEYSDRLGCELDHLFPDDPCQPPPSAAAPIAPA